MSRKTRIVNRLSKGIESYLFKKNKITLFKGQARLEGPGNVIVKGEGGETKIKTKNVLLATGSRPRSLPGLDPRRQDDHLVRRDPADPADPTLAWSSSGRARWGWSSRPCSRASAPR